MLAFYYVPEPTRAYESVSYITNQVPFGWYIRGIHQLVLLLHDHLGDPARAAGLLHRRLPQAA